MKLFRNLKSRNPRNKTEPLHALIKKHNKEDTFVICRFVWLIIIISVLYIDCAYQQV